MVHDRKGFILIGLNPGARPATIGIIDVSRRSRCS
jgi:hypothetical protein